MTLYHPFEPHSPSIEVLSTLILSPWGKYYIYGPIYSFISSISSPPVITHESIFSKLYYLADSQPEEARKCLPENSSSKISSPKPPSSFTGRLSRWLGITSTNKPES